MKEIKVAEHSGFCFGVKRAIEKTEEQLSALRQIEELTRLYLEKYGQMEIVFPLQTVMVTNTMFIEFNPIWD